VARPCSVCVLPTRGSIDDLIRQGRSVRQVTADFGLAYDSALRHARHHVARETVPLIVMPGAPSRTNGHTSPDAVVDPLDELVAVLRVRALGHDVAAAREYRLALAATATRASAAVPKVDLASTDEWIAFRTVMLGALEPYPEARIAIADALKGM
jgi:hypothetical protein